MKYYAINVKFQVHGLSHVYCLLWIVNAPSLIEGNVEEYISLIK